MDVLADVIAAVRNGRAVASRTVGRSPWGLRFGDPVGMVFHVVVSGSCWLTLSDLDPVRLDAGDVVLLPEPGPHTLSDRPGAPSVDFGDVVDELDEPIGGLVIGGDGPAVELLCGAYLVHRSGSHPLLRAMPEMIHLRAHGAARSSSMGATVALLAEEVQRQDPGAAIVIGALVDALLVHIVREGFAQVGDGWVHALSDPPIADALSAIHADPSAPWTVQQLAAAAGLSRSTFARRFRQHVGEAPLGYLTRWRMIAAARLLRDTDEPLRAVARRVGYVSEFAFSRAFRREYAVAPGRYRRASGSAVSRTRGRPA